MAAGVLNLKLADKALNVLEAELRRQEKRVRLSAAIALSKTADRAAVAIREEMGRVFDRPTRWTLNALWVRRARAGVKTGSSVVDLTASVKIKDIAAKGTPAVVHLAPQIEGGARQLKRYEYALRMMGILGPNEYTVPGDAARLNKFGNIPGPTLAKMLADVQAKNYNTPADARYNLRFGQATLKAGKKRFFYSPYLRPRAIWERKGRYRTGQGRIAPFLVFVKGPPRYKKRLDFYGIAERVFDQWIEVELSQAVAFVKQPKRVRR